MIAPPPFNAEAALRVACGHHRSAMMLEKIHEEEILRKVEILTVDIVYQRIGTVVSSTVLEALALELVLKVRLDLAQVGIQRTHNHAELFAKLPASEKQQAELRYQASRYPGMRATLEEALEYSAEIFEQWRYLHERPQVEASMGEMQRAFEALAHGL